MSAPQSEYGSTRSDVPPALDWFRCPACHASLGDGGSGLSCAACERSFPVSDGVVRFLDHEDAFYEGAYARQIRYLPRGDGPKDWTFFHLIQSGVLGEIKRVLPPGGRVLDLGCAGGIRWLGRDAVTVGVDLSIASLEVAATTYAAALQASVLELPIADESVDVVYGSYLFEHLTQADKRRCLAEVSRVLRPGGAVVLQFDTLSDNALTRFARRDPTAFQRAFIDNDGHVGLAPVTETLAIFAAAGMRVERTLHFGTTALQYLATYQWLDAGYGERHLWVRALGAAARKLSASKLGLAYELIVTAFDRLLSPIAEPDRATRIIVVAHRP